MTKASQSPKSNTLIKDSKGKEIRLDQREVDFLKRYLDPKSDTYGNAKQSALKAGFSDKYSDNITVFMPKWLGESLGHMRRLGMFEKAQRNLEELLDLDVFEPAMGPSGPIVDKKTKKPVMHRNIKAVALRQDTSKFVAETLGKRHFSKRTEVTGEGGGAIVHEYHLPKKQLPGQWLGDKTAPPKS